MLNILAAAVLAGSPPPTVPVPDDFVLSASQNMLMSTAPRAPACTGVAPDLCDFSDAWDCSVPSVAESVAAALTAGVFTIVHNSYKELFTLACVRHDGCYRHGMATYGHSKSDCDNMFYSDMKDRCEGLEGWDVYLTLGLNKATCHAAAKAYFEAVQNFGDDSYHDGDSTICYYDRGNENAHVHRIREDGRFGDAVHRYMWSSGWWVVGGHTAGGVDHLMFLKPSTGKTHVHTPTASGSVGPRVEAHDWTSGWTTATTFTVGDKPYLFLLKSSNGAAQVREFKADGTVGSKIREYNWTCGWTIAHFYTVKKETYLILIKGTASNPSEAQSLTSCNRTNGLVHVHKMNPDGTVGARVDTRNWTSGWSLARTYEVKNKPYLFILKSGNGVAQVREINNDGTVGPAVKAYNWSDGWTTVEPYEVGSKPYLFLLKAGNGSAKVYEVKDDGTVGATVKTYDWRAGWTSVTFYRSGSELFAILVKGARGGTT